MGEEDFVTAVFGELRPGPPRPRLRLISCGHPAPLLVRDGTVATIELAARPPLGLGEPAWWADDVRGVGAVEVDICPGERVLFYTDGLVEARDTERRFVPLQRLAAALTPSPDAETPDVALERLLSLLRMSTGGVLADDLALLLLQHPVGAVAVTAGDVVRA
jgi:serine phosphatase RsbU (regulator of sigma subunit)